MIIVDDKQVEALEARRLAEEQEQEPPPTYASLHHGGVVLEQAPPPIGLRSAAALTVSSSPTLNSNASSPFISSPNGGNANRNIKRVNHLAITRTHASIRETVLVDPSLFVPVFLRPPLLPGETEESRRNLRIEAIHGNVWADIKVVGVGFGEGDRSFRGFSSRSSSTVVGGDGDDDEDDDDGSETVIGMPAKKESKGKRVFMQLKSTHGGIQAKIHGPPNRHPVVLHASATHGDIKLYLPRSFHGPIIIAHRHGLVRFSDALAQDLTTFGEVDGIRRCFLGDFSAWAKQAEKQKQRCKEKEREEKTKEPPSPTNDSNSSTSPCSPSSPSKDSTGLFGFSKDKSHKVQKKRSIVSSNDSEWSSDRSHSGNSGRSMLEEVAEQSGLGTESGWTGDELLVEVRHANVKLQYCDDAPKTAVKSRPTFLNRIFGF